jgi:hypothetical protein
MRAAPGSTLHSKQEEASVYLVLFLDADNNALNPSLHTNRADAEAAYKELVQRFDCKPCLGGLADDCGEAPHLYRIEADGKLGEEIYLYRRLVALS